MLKFANDFYASDKNCIICAPNSELINLRGTEESKLNSHVIIKQYDWPVSEMKLFFLQSSNTIESALDDPHQCVRKSVSISGI